MSIRTILRMVVVTLAVAFTAQASTALAQEGLEVTTPFAFRVGPKVCEPGTYDVRVSGDGALITFSAVKGAASLALVTRLAASDPPISEGRVVFDKVGDLYYASEVWIPGFDGYLVSATKGAHTHVNVKIAKTK